MSFGKDEMDWQLPLVKQTVCKEAIHHSTPSFSGNHFTGYDEIGNLGRVEQKHFQILQILFSDNDLHYNIVRHITMPRASKSSESKGWLSKIPLSSILLNFIHDIFVERVISDPFGIFHFYCYRGTYQKEGILT